MKPGIIFFVCILSLMQFGCKNDFQHIVEQEKTIDFRYTYWLINHIDTDLYAYAKKDLTDLLLKRFEKMGGASIFFLEDIKPDSAHVEPPAFYVSREKLMEVSRNKTYDYLVNTKVEVTEDDSCIRADILIYDLSAGEIFYSQKTIHRINDPGVFRSYRSLMRNILETMREALDELEKHIIT